MKAPRRPTHHSTIPVSAEERGIAVCPQRLLLVRIRARAAACEFVRAWLYVLVTQVAEPIPLRIPMKHQNENAATLHLVLTRIHEYTRAWSRESRATTLVRDAHLHQIPTECTPFTDYLMSFFG